MARTVVVVVGYLLRDAHRGRHRAIVTSHHAELFRLYLKPLPVHMNLWLVNGQAPTNGQEVEIVIRKFTYTPMPVATSTSTAIPTAGATARGRIGGVAVPSNLAWR